MTQILKRLIKLAALGFVLTQGTAFAAFTMYVYQSGANVVASGSGSLNLAGVTVGAGGSGPAQVNPPNADLITGPTVTESAFSVTGPTSFGPGPDTIATSSSGTAIWISGLVHRLFFDQTYVSGASISSSATWNATTLAALGLTTGTYTWTWGAGANADSYTLIVGSAPPAPVPALTLHEEAALALAMVAAAGFLMRRTRARI